MGMECVLTGSSKKKFHSLYFQQNVALESFRTTDKTVSNSCHEQMVDSILFSENNENWTVAINTWNWKQNKKSRYENESIQKAQKKSSV